VISFTTQETGKKREKHFTGLYINRLSHNFMIGYRYPIKKICNLWHSSNVCKLYQLLIFYFDEYKNHISRRQYERSKREIFETDHLGFTLGLGLEPSGCWVAASYCHVVLA